MATIENWAKQLRSAGVIIGVPTIVAAAIFFHNAQVSTLKEQIELLRQTQYDRALPIIEAQNKLRDHERRIVSEMLLLTNESMKYVEEFTHHQTLPEDFSPKRFERNIQEVAERLKELQELMVPKLSPHKSLRAPTQ